VVSCEWFTDVRAEQIYVEAVHNCVNLACCVPISHVLSFFSAVLHKQVNTGVLFRNHTPVLTGPRSEAQPDPTKEPHFQLYELSITDLTVALEPGISTTGKPGEAEEESDSESEGPDSDLSGLSQSRSGDSVDEGVHTHYIGFGKVSSVVPFASHRRCCALQCVVTSVSTKASSRLVTTLLAVFMHRRNCAVVATAGELVQERQRLPRARHHRGGHLQPSPEQPGRRRRTEASRRVEDQVGQGRFLRAAV
jgi:hypothetical protein